MLLLIQNKQDATFLRYMYEGPITSVHETDGPVLVTGGPAKDCPGTHKEPAKECPGTHKEPAKDCPGTHEGPVTDASKTHKRPATDCPPTDGP